MQGYELCVHYTLLTEVRQIIWPQGLCAATTLITFSALVEHKRSPEAMTFSGHFLDSIRKVFEFSYQYSYGILHRRYGFNYIQCLNKYYTIYFH
jgi:hypothetical protein